MTRFAVALACCAGMTLAADGHERLVSRRVYLMGTQVTLSTFDRDRARGAARLERLLAALEDADARLSTWRDESELSRLNAAAGRGARTLSPRLCAALTVADRWVDESGGAFDPAIGAFIEAWDLHGHGRVPAMDELAAARERSGWRRVRFDAARCTIALPPGVTLDVGAWGKGEALDRARAAAVDGAAPWLVDLGGQVAAQGAPPGAHAWPIAIAHPLRRDEAAIEVRLREGSLATSAGSERDLFVDGRRVGHILDPRTGMPASFTGAVSVWHERALAADILSTALFVMGPERGLAWAEARSLAACYLVPDGAGNGVLANGTTVFARRFGVCRGSGGVGATSNPVAGS